MKFHTRVQLYFNRLRFKVKEGKDYSLQQTLSLIRKEARDSMRVRRGASRPGTPPSVHTKAGLRDIQWDVQGNSGYVGPRKFRRKNRLNKPVPGVHEHGGVAIERPKRGRARLKRFPERSFMWSAVKKLKAKGKLASKFKFMLARG